MIGGSCNFAMKFKFVIRSTVCGQNNNVDLHCSGEILTDIRTFNADVCNKCRYEKCPALSQYKFGKLVIPDGLVFDHPRGDSSLYKPCFYFLLVIL